MKDIPSLARAVVKLGVTPLMRAAGFKRPGGGMRYLRDRGRVRQFVYVCTEFQRGFGRLRLQAEQRVGYHRVWTHLSYDVFLDVALGDLQDAAVQAAAHVEESLLPNLEQELDLVSAARYYERQPCLREELGRVRSAQLWTLIGRPEEAERVLVGAQPALAF